MSEAGNIFSKISFLTGSDESIGRLQRLPALPVFSEDIIEFLSDVSKRLMQYPDARNYPDVVTLGFFLRKASLKQLRARFVVNEEKLIRIGQGVAFHIAPSNVPVNFAYSLVAGLLGGNANIVRIPSKEFPQVSIITGVLNESLKKYPKYRDYIILVRYERDRQINDYFSSIADVRIVWGGDETIEEIRKSPLPPRSTEITFANRYSIAIIDSDVYMKTEDKVKVAKDFYNDTYLSDQHACTSPRIVIWLGDRKEEAKEVFWDRLHALVKTEYGFQDIQGVNKYTTACIAATEYEGLQLLPREDNLLFRMKTSTVDRTLMNQMENSGFFYEYDCNDIMELKDLCDDKHCQTIGVLGDSKALMPLVNVGLKGIDRIVPIGHTMDFDLIWDGMDLVSRLSRYIYVG